MSLRTGAAQLAGRDKAYRQATEDDARSFSAEVSSAAAWSPDFITTLGLPGELAAQAFDPVQSLLCVATKSGSLHLFGAGPVKLEWAPRPSYAVKFLAFKPGSAFLFVIDVKNTLIVFDLSDVSPTTNEPNRWAVLSLRSEATCLECPAGHAHAFIGFKDGTVNCFDLLTAKMSPYLIPNVWQQHLEVLRRSGMSDAPKRYVPMCTDIKSHPRDLNHILLGYEGGVVLWDWSNKRAAATYDLLLPPGAVGGSDEHDPNLFSDRRPSVTCLSWRPDGLVFCAGHDDGCLSFWDVDDGDKPIQVRTMDRPDVNIANAEQLFAATEGPEAGRPPILRQPVFALAWSGFSQEGFYDRWSSTVRNATGGGAAAPAIPKVEEEAEADEAGVTVLTVLGGLLDNDAVGVHCLVFKPYEDRSKTMGKMSTAASAAQVQRQSLRDSLMPTGRIQYPTWTAPEDFCLLSDTPWFGGTFDPTAILILEAPDPSLADASPNTPSAARSCSAYAFARASHLQPKKLSLPPDLELVGHSRMTSAQTDTCGISALQSLVNIRAANEAPYAPIKGGQAMPRLHQHANKQTLAAGLRTPRILTSTHVDRSVRFWDISSSLLTNAREAEDGSQMLVHAYPKHLCTIDMMSLLLATNILTASKVWQTTPELVFISSVSSAFEVGEVAVSLSSGECIIFRLGIDSPEPIHSPSAPSAPADPPMSPVSPTELGGRLPSPAPSQDSHGKGGSSSSRMKSAFGKANFLKRSSGSVSSKPGLRSSQSQPQPASASVEDVTISDLSAAPQPPPGVLAFRPAYCIARHQSVESCSTSLTDTGFLAIGWADGGLTLVDLRGPDCIYHKTFRGERAAVLEWAVAPSGEDLRPLPRLYACFSSGTIRQFALNFSLDTWIVAQQSLQDPELRQHNSLSNPIAATVMDKYGDECAVTARTVEDAQFTQEPEQVKDPNLHSFLIVAAKTSAAVFINSTAGRLAKADYAEAAAARVVKYGRRSSALFIMCNDGSMLGYSLPQLELLFQHRPLPSEGMMGTVSAADDGEFVDFQGPAYIAIRSAFANGRGQAPPDVDAFNPNITLPSMPAMPGNFISSWWSGQPRLTPDSLDALLGGPDRKPRAAPKSSVPKTSAQRKAQQQSVTEEYEVEDGRPALSEAQRMLQERGQALNYLNDTFSEVGQGAKDMFKEARGLAVQQAAKDKFIGFFK